MLQDANDFRVCKKAYMFTVAGILIMTNAVEAQQCRILGLSPFVRILSYAEIGHGRGDVRVAP
jgi:hypothetical protein